MRKTEQKVVIVSSDCGGYYNFFKYGYELQNNFREGWLLKFIKDDTKNEIVTCVFERNNEDNFENILKSHNLETPNTTSDTSSVSSKPPEDCL